MTAAFDEASLLKLAINFVLDNCFFNFDNVSVRRIIVVFMNFNCLFSNLFRFIDNLRAINNHLEFDKNYKVLYIYKKSDKIIKIRTVFMFKSILNSYNIMLK